MRRYSTRRLSSNHPLRNPQGYKPPHFAPGLSTPLCASFQPPIRPLDDPAARCPSGRKYRLPPTWRLLYSSSFSWSPVATSDGSGAPSCNSRQDRQRSLCLGMCINSRRPTNSGLWPSGGNNMVAVCYVGSIFWLASLTTRRQGRSSLPNSSARPRLS